MSDKSLVNLSDVAGLSQPLTKLVECVGNATGVLYEPKRIEKKARAEAKAAIIKAKAEAQSKDIENRMQARIHYRELKRQQNIESITKEAASQLSEKDSITDNPVDEDWINRFFDECQDISDEEMQTLWGKVLAGELEQPSSFSFRTIKILKDLSKKEAHWFTNVCSFTWIFPQLNALCTPLVYSTDSELITKKGINFSVLQDLESIGLIQFNSTSGYRLKNISKILASYCGELYLLEKDAASDLQIGKVMFTPVGKELFKIANAPCDHIFKKEVLKKWENDGFAIRSFTGSANPSSQ